MPATIEDLQQFHQFALEFLQGSGAVHELDELLLIWHDQRHSQELDAVISQGLQQVDAGQGRPVREVTQEISQRLGLSES